MLPLIFGGNLPSKWSKRTWQCSEMVLFNLVFRLIFWNMYNLTCVVFIVTQQNVRCWWVRTQIWYALSSAKIILALIMLRFLENKGVFLTVNKLVRRVSHLLRPLSPVHEKDTDRNGVWNCVFCKTSVGNEVKYKQYVENYFWISYEEFLPRKLSFSLYVEFSEKQTFLPPDTHAYVDVSEVKKC